MSASHAGGREFESRMVHSVGILNNPKETEKESTIAEHQRL